MQKVYQTFPELYSVGDGMHKTSKSGDFEERFNLKDVKCGGCDDEIKGYFTLQGKKLSIRLETVRVQRNQKNIKYFSSTKRKAPAQSIITTTNTN